MLKKSQSGLGSVQRSWTEGGASSQETASSSPAPQPSTQQMSARDLRLKKIKEALAASGSKMVPKQAQPDPPLSTSQSQNNKRSSDGRSEDAPAKKPRQLPSSWENASASASSSTSGTQSTSQISSGKPKIASVFLSSEQTHILRLVQDGHNVFYTGSAGTGKSVLLREIIKTLKKKHPKSSDAVAVTASTGIAACNIGGVTIHSFAGIGLGIESADDLVTKIRKNRKASSRWLRTKVLIIDEVSMLDGNLFDKLARISMKLRKSTKDFGGIQIIVTGDFFQLPPVTKGEVKFAFEAELWNETIAYTFNLTKVFRQRDQEFVDMLNEMRFGRLSQKSIAKFRSLSRPINYEDGVGATELFSHRADVDRSNSTRMQCLQGEERMYRSRDAGMDDGPQRDKLLGNFMAPKELILRTNAQVMLIKNMDEQLVNGSLGTIVSFMTPEEHAEFEARSGKPPSTATTAPKEKASTSVAGTIPYPVVDFILASGGKRRIFVSPEQWKVELPTGEVQASRTQLPLILSWAMSIHKSQGQTLERVKVDLGKVFEKGQAYVALSRATSMAGLQVLNFDPKKVQAHPRVVAWCEKLQTVNESNT